MGIAFGFVGFVCWYVVIPLLARVRRYSWLGTCLIVVGCVGGGLLLVHM